MQFKFVGNPRAMDNRGSITAFGVSFPLNVPVTVDDPMAIKKLMGNDHFVIVDGAKSFYQGSKLVDAPALVAPDGSALTSDCEDQTSPDAADKAALLARAGALGVEVDKRWGAKRLTEEIEKASGDKG
jgi:hypothetical protein